MDWIAEITFQELNQLAPTISCHLFKILMLSQSSSRLWSTHLTRSRMPTSYYATPYKSWNPRPFQLLTESSQPATPWAPSTSSTPPPPPPRACGANQIAPPGSVLYISFGSIAQLNKQGDSSWACPFQCSCYMDPEY